MLKNKHLKLRAGLIGVMPIAIFALIFFTGTAGAVEKQKNQHVKNRIQEIGKMIRIENDDLFVELVPKPSSAEKRVKELLAERIKDRTGLSLATSADKAKFRLVIGKMASSDKIKAFLGTCKEITELGGDGYCIAVDPKKTELYVVGHSDSGVVAGVGRLMREMRYSQDKLELPCIDVRETPQMPNRGMYLWARKYYFDEPDRVDRYIEELALWGCNAICFWFEMGMFDNFESTEELKENSGYANHMNKRSAPEYLNMYRRFYKTARSMGMKTGLLMVANDAYRTSPKEMRIEPIIGCPNCYLCPSKPGAVKQMVDWQEEVFKALAPIDIFNIFPSDPGGCSCKDCQPWPTHGFWKMAKPLGKRIHEISPKTEIWIDTWHMNHKTFGAKDWQGLIDRLASSKKRPGWFTGFEVGIAPHHRYAHMTAKDRQCYNKAKQPLMVFPDISMWANHKGMLVNQAYWKDLQVELTDYDSKLMKGGWPYTERWNTDIANVVFLSWFSDPKKSVETILDEYSSFYFGPEAATGRKLIELLDDSNKDPKRKEKIKEIAAKLEKSLPDWAKTDWRWAEILQSCSRFK
jgi:hypothetical protein